MMGLIRDTEETGRRCAPLCAILGLFGLCLAPAAAQEPQSGAMEAAAVIETPTSTAAENALPVAAGAASIQASDEGPGGGNLRRRLPLERMLRDILFGVAWDRTRLPLRASLYGNESKTFAIQMSLSRHNFSGVTLRLKF